MLFEFNKDDEKMMKNAYMVNEELLTGQERMVRCC